MSGKSFGGGMNKGGPIGGSDGFRGGPAPVTKVSVVSPASGRPAAPPPVVHTKVSDGLKKDFPVVRDETPIREDLRRQADRLARSTAGAAVMPGPRLFGCVLVSGLSYDLYPFFIRLVDDIGKLSGPRMRFYIIGHPGKSDPTYLASLTESEMEQLRESERAFVEEVHAMGKTDTHVIRKSSVIATLVGLEPSILPCIAFAVGGHLDRTVALRFCGYWYRTEQARHILGKVLLKELKDGDLLPLLDRGLAGPKLLAQVQGIAKHIAREIDDAIFRDRDAALILRGSAGSKRSKRSVVLRINLREGRVFLRGQEIALGTAAFDTLCALAREPGVHIPRGELYSRVTGSDECVDSSQRAWAKDRLNEIRDGLRAAIGKRGVTREAVEALITAEDHRIWLNLGVDQIEFR